MRVGRSNTANMSAASWSHAHCSAPWPKPVRGRNKMAKTHITMKVNGAEVEGLVEPRTLLVHFIRENLQLTGTHIGCETTHCGACTVDIDGMSVKSCTMFAVQAQGSDIM